MLQDGYRKAAVEKKNVMANFHASWCGPCRKMDRSHISAKDGTSIGRASNQCNSVCTGNNCNTTQYPGDCKKQYCYPFLFFQRYSHNFNELSWLVWYQRI